MMSLHGRVLLRTSRPLLRGGGNLGGGRGTPNSLAHRSLQSSAADAWDTVKDTGNKEFGMGGYQSRTPLRSDSPMVNTATQAPVVSSWTEWQPLEEVIVGRCELSCIPQIEPAFQVRPRPAVTRSQLPTSLPLCRRLQYTCCVLPLAVWQLVTCAY